MSTHPKVWVVVLTDSIWRQVSADMTIESFWTSEAGARQRAETLNIRSEGEHWDAVPVTTFDQVCEP